MSDWFSPHTVTLRPVTQEQNPLTLDADNPSRGVERSIQGDVQVLRPEQLANRYGFVTSTMADLYLTNPSDAQYFQPGYEVVWNGHVWAIEGDPADHAAGDELDHGFVTLRRTQEDQ